MQSDPRLVLPLLLEDFSGSHIAAPHIDTASKDTLLPVTTEHVLFLTDALVSLEVVRLGGYARPALAHEPCPRIPSSNLHCHSDHYNYKPPPIGHRAKQTLKLYPHITYIYGTLIHRYHCLDVHLSRPSAGPISIVATLAPLLLLPKIFTLSP